MLALLPLISAGVVLFYGLLLGLYVLSLRPQVRLARWAAQNRLAYGNNIKNMRWDGSLFPRDTESITTYVIESDDFTIASYRQLPGDDGRMKFAMPPVTFLTVPLPRKVPNILLVNKRAGALARQWVSFSKQHQLELEGDFQKYFSLYCPAEYERDALYIFTPDLMAKVVDVAGDVEIELKGDKAYIYFGKNPRLDKREMMQKAMALVEELSGALQRRTMHYKDEKVSGEVKKRNIALALSGQSVHRKLPTKRVILTYIGIGLSWVVMYFAIQYFFGG